MLDALTQIAGKRFFMASRVKVDCPHCQERTAVPAKYAGKKGRCPHCDSGIRAPDLD